jgi:hypothetical protein
VLVGQQPGDAGEDALPGGVELVAGDLVDRGAQPVLGDPLWRSEISELSE